ncbi:MAG: UvrD-helicase domain-containing protein, partial [Bacteroidota bacterium]
APEEQDVAHFEQWLEEDLRAPIDWDRAVLKPLGSEEWETLLLGGSDELERRLTQEQRELVERTGSILLSGTAGSGKTTVAVFRLLELAGRPAGNALYLAYSPWLVQYARDLFRKLLPEAHRDDPAVWKRFHFQSVRELAQELLGIEPSIVGYPYFHLLFRRWPDRDIQPATAWSEIRSIIKGANLSPDKPLLDKEAYLQIGKKRAPDLEVWRPELFRLAQRYQKHLEDHRLLDELDLVRSALRALPVEARGRYASILCDEVQDFTELHLELAFRLLDWGGTLFCTGDLNQVVNPSGFRWEEVRKQFYRRNLEIPQLDRLSTNFRSVGSIVELADALLLLRSRLLGTAPSPDDSTYLLSGDVPGVLDGKEADLFPLLSEIDARQAVLVRTEAEREQLKVRTNSPFIFTIEEAKGLEFDGVLVWDFFRGEKNLWRKALRSRLSPKERPVLRYELNLLYVAITRPRRRLRFFDPDPFLWEEPELLGKTLRVSPSELSVHSALSGFGQTLSPEEWGARGDYFFAHEFFDQAIACYERYPDLPLHREKAQRARGRLHEQAEAWLEAAEAYRGIPDLPAAARMLLRARKWGEAAALFQTLGEPEQADRCWAEEEEAHGKYREASERWLSLDPERALQCIKRTKDPETIARFEASWLLRSGDFEGAARKWERLGHFFEAADAWTRLGALSRATEAYRWAFEQAPERLPDLLKQAEGNPSLQCALAFIRPEEALRWFSRAAEGGHPEALYQLGLQGSRPHLLAAAEAGHLGALYELGAEDPAFYRKAAERGHLPSQWKLGSLLETPEGLEWLEKAAEAGHLEAQFELANRLEARERPAQAFRWYRRAEQGGHPEAPFRLGLCYLQGMGTPQNPSKAKFCFLAAAEKGHPEAQFELARLLFAETVREATRWYQRAAEAGHVPAMHALGEIHYYGEAGKEDPEAAAHWYRAAAERGHAPSQYSLGFMLSHGLPRDPAAAVHWLRLAAEQGHREAQHELGETYQQDEHPEEALHWFSLAAQSEHPDSLYRLGRFLLKQGDPAAQDWLHRAAEKGHPGAQFELSTVYADSREISLAWCRKAAEQGHVDAQYRLGFTFFQEGEARRAIPWFSRAAEQGDEMSMVYLGLIYEEGRGVPVDRERALHWYGLAAERGEPRAREGLERLR